MVLKIGSKKWLSSSQLAEGVPLFDRDLFVEKLEVPKDLRMLRGGSSANQREIEVPEDEEEEAEEMSKEFAFTITSFTKDEMNLQLIFTSPDFISHFEVDALVFEFQST